MSEGAKPRPTPWSVRAPEPLWVSLVVCALNLVPGLLSLWLGKPWLFPSLGPTTFLQAHKPDLPSSHLYNVIVGHGLGVLMGYAFSFLLDSGSPSFFELHALTGGRLAATVLALGATMSLQAVTASDHPSGAATVMLITFGGFEPRGRDVWGLIAGILITGLLGEVFRRMRRGDVPGQR